MPDLPMAVFATNDCVLPSFAGLSVQTLPCPSWRELSAESWQQAIEGTDAEYVATLPLLIDDDSELILAELTAALTELESNPATLAVAIPDVWSAPPFSHLPASFALLSHLPGPFGFCVIRRDEFLATPLESNIAQPLAAWLLQQLTTEVERVHVVSRRADQPLVMPVHPCADLVPAAPSRSSHWLRDACYRYIETLPVTTPPTERTALLAGLLQWHDFLDDSHTESQSIEGLGIDQNGDYWHAIMHRREPDYSNAKYWFEQVGDHLHFSYMASYINELRECNREVFNCMEAEGIADFCPDGRWDPLAFVDFCQFAHESGNVDVILFAEHLQWYEMEGLLAYSWERAVEG